MFRQYALVTWYLIYDWQKHKNTKDHIRSSLNSHFLRQVARKNGDRVQRKKRLTPFPLADFASPPTSSSSAMLSQKTPPIAAFSVFDPLPSSGFRWWWRSWATWSKDTSDHLDKEDCTRSSSGAPQIAPHKPTPRTGTKKRFVPCINSSLLFILVSGSRWAILTPSSAFLL